MSLSKEVVEVPYGDNRSRISNVLLVTPAPLGVGGLGTAVGEFADGLQELGYSSTHVGSQSASLLRRTVTSRPIRRAFGMSLSRRLDQRGVRRAVPRAGWDLAYATPGSVPIEHDGGVHVICQASRHPAFEWAALRRGERETGGRGHLSRAEFRRREYEIARADLIHVTTHAVENEFLEAGIPDWRLVHSYHGVDLARFKPGAKADNMTIAFVGPLSMCKGVDKVDELATRLRGSTTVETVGGPTCPWSRRITERAPFVSRESVPETLQRAHVLVLPSRSDGFSYAVLEALASGTVPIVTPEVGASEIVRRLDERLVVAREDFVDATIELLQHLDIGELATRARLLAEHFSRAETSRALATAVLERTDISSS